MIDLTVKTLDSQNHKYSVPDEITVRQFKEKVAGSVGVPADKQRLIYCGRVLQDDKKLSDYDVNGKVIHLVQRPPPPSATRPSTSASSSSSSQPTTGSASAAGAQTGFGARGGSPQEFLLGAFTIPSDVMDPNQVQQIVHQVVSGMGEYGRNATIMSRTSDDGSTVDVHINLGQVPLMGESRQRIANARNMIRRANACINRLEQRNDNNGNGSSRTSPTGEGTSAEEAATSASVPSFLAEGEEGAVENFAESVAVAEIIEGEIFIRPSIAVSGGAGGAFPVIADAARLAATTALAAATAPVTEIPPPAPAGSSASTQTQENARTAPGARSADGANGASSGNAPQPANGQQPRHNPTHLPVLATLMEELSTLQGRLQPYLLQFQNMLREDRDYRGNAEEQTRSQRAFNLVSEALHFVSHAYHTVSDIMVDFAQAPPRTLRSRAVVQQPSFMQAAMPLQGQINFGAVNAAAMHAAAAAAAANQAAGAAATAATAAAAAAADAAGLIPAATPSGIPAANPSGVSVANPTDDAAPNGSTNAAPAADIHQNTANLPLGIGIPAQLAGFFQSQSPVVFVEVGPITATVVSDAAAGQPVQLTGNNGQSQARGNTATQPTTSTQTRSTSRPIQTIPIAFPGMGHPNFDPYLPCASHHVAQGRRPVIPLRTLVPHQQPQGNAASTSPIDTQLAGVIANMMSALFSNPTPAAANGSAATATGPPGNTATPGGSSAPPGAAFGRAGMQQLGRVRRMLGELLTLRRNVGDPSYTSTIADFLRTLPDYSYQEGEGLISDLVMTLARRMSLREFVELLFGRSETLNRLRVPLQEFVRQRVLNDAEPNDDNVRSAVGRLATSMIDVLRISVQDIDIREGVNYFATLRNFLEAQLFSVIRIILSTRDDDFGNALYAASRQIIMEDVVLNIHCFRHGQRALETFLQNTVRQIAVDLDPFIQQWMTSMCTVQIRAMIPNITVREADILQYVVREAAAAATAQTTEPSAPSPLQPAQPATLPTTSVPGLSSASSGTSACQSPMESSSSLDEYGFSDALPARVAQLPRTAEKKSQSPVVTAVAPSASLSETEMEDAVPTAVPMDTSEPNLPPTGGAWQGAVPVEWVPIIAEDVQRQRRQSVQRPFSDAYVATMPSKRRKMMNGEKLQTVVEGGVLSDTLQRAIGVVGAQPTTSLDAVLGDVAANPALNSAFQDHLTSSVSHRLRTDDDYCPEKFPNADILFRCRRPDGEP